MAEYAVITHTDMDGVAGAGVYALASGEWPRYVYFTEPYKLHRLLGEKLGKIEEVEKLVVIDLGVNPGGFPELVGSVRELAAKGVSVEWYDHHLWDGEWVAAVSGAGVKLYLDTSTCATGVVYRYYAAGRVNREIAEELVPGVCAGDLWTFDHWRGGWYLRLIRRGDSDSWRLKVMREVFKGRAWTSSFTEKVEEAMDGELRALSSVESIVVREADGIRVVAAYENSDVENSFLAAYLLTRYSADVAVIASVDGKLSLRSRSVDVRRVAVKLGGGGHMYASGAKVSIPLSRKLLSLVDKKALLNYVADKVYSALV